MSDVTSNETANPLLSPSDLNADVFRARLNETFRLSEPGIEDGEVVEVDLVDVSGLKGDSSREDRSPFSLLFRGPEALALEQAIYRFENDEMGEMDLFVVCVGPDPDDRQMRYEVIFT